MEKWLKRIGFAALTAGFAGLLLGGVTPAHAKISVDKLVEYQMEQVVVLGNGGQPFKATPFKVKTIRTILEIPGDDIPTFEQMEAAYRNTLEANGKRPKPGGCLKQKYQPQASDPKPTEAGFFVRKYVMLCRPDYERPEKLSPAGKIFAITVGWGNGSGKTFRVNSAEAQYALILNPTQLFIRAWGALERINDPADTLTEVVVDNQYIPYANMPRVMGFHALYSPNGSSAAAAELANWMAQVDAAAFERLGIDQAAAFNRLMLVPVPES